MAANCSIKLIKKTFLGTGIRMTSDKNTIPFDNKPMTNLKIDDYNDDGFQISHESLGKSIWVKFEQLPLTELTLINGIIQDEITFVENIVYHRMVLIKTNNSEYTELLKNKEEEKLEEFIKLKDVAIGETIISAQCKDGVPMVYLGSWITKGVKEHNPNGYYYRNNDRSPIKYYLGEHSPKRAFFAIEDLSSYTRAEQKQMLLECDNPYDLDDKWNGQERSAQSKKRDENDRFLKNLKLENSKQKNTKIRYKIKSFPITSKIIKSLIKTDVFDKDLMDIELNCKIIQDINISKSLDFYNMKYYSDNKMKIIPPVLEYAAQITNKRQFEPPFMATSKKDIDIKARKFYESIFGITLETGSYEDRYNH